MFGRNKKNKKSALQTERSFFGKKLNFAAREAYKLLRTNLLFALPEGEEGRARIIGVTSSLRGEGKAPRWSIWPARWPKPTPAC